MATPGTPVLFVIENRCQEANTGMHLGNLGEPQARRYTLPMSGLFVLIIVVVALWAGSAVVKVRD